MKDYNYIFQNYNLTGYNVFTVTIDLADCNGLIIYNGSLAGTDLRIFPVGITITAGEKFSFTGNELEKYSGKITVNYQKFFADILPNFTVIKKYFI